MHSQNNSDKKETKKKSRGRKLIKWFLVVLVLVVLIFFIVIPAYLSSQSGKNFIISRVNPLIDGKIQMAEFSMGWFKGIRLTDFQFADNAGTTQVKVKEISTKPRYGSLLLGNVALGKTLIDTPEVIVNIKETPESEEIPPASAPEQKEQKQIVMPLAQMDLLVKQGNATINMETPRQAVRSVRFQNIESKVAIKPPGGESNFALSLAVADGAETPAKISANGSVTPAKSKGGWSLKGTNGDFQVVVDNLELETLEPLFSIAGVEFGAKGNLNADIDMRVDDGRIGKLDAKATLADFARAVAGKELVLAEPVELDAKLSSEAEQVVIDKVQLKSSFCTLDCTGGINSVDYIAKADLKGLQDFAGQFVDFADYSLAGGVVEKGNVSFDKDKIKFKGAADITGFVAGKDKVKTSPTDALVSFDMGIDTAKKLMDIGMLKLTSEPTTIELKADSISLNTENGLEFNVKAKTTADLNKVQPFAALAVSLPEGLNIAGALDSSITVNSGKTGYHILTEATNVKNLVIAKPNVEPFKQEQINLSADVLCDPVKKTVAINTLNLESKQDGSLVKVTKGTFSQSTEKDQTLFEGQLQADYDLQTVSSMASAFMPEGLTMAGKRTAGLEFKSKYPTNEPEKLKQNLNGKASFGFDRAEYMGLNIGNVNTEIEIKEGLMALKPFTTDVNNGKFTFGGNIDLKQKPLVLTTPGPMHIMENININEQMTGHMLKYLNPLFAEQSRVSGKADFYCDRFAIPLGGLDKNKIVVEGTVRMDDVKLQSAALVGQILAETGSSGQIQANILPTKFVLENGALGYKEMQVNLDKYPATFGGTIRLDKQIDMTVKVPYKIDTQAIKLRTVEIGDDLSARLEVGIEGTVDKPRINLNKLIESGLQEMLKGTVDDAIRKGLEKLFE